MIYENLRINLIDAGSEPVDSIDNQDRDRRVENQVEDHA